MPMTRFFAVCSFIVLLMAQVVFAGPLEDCQQFARLGLPSSGNEILCRKGYLLGHSSERKTPVWVIEHLEHIRINGPVARTDDFKPDPDLQKGSRAELADYVKSGYQRGHMAPADDMSWDEKAMHESFYLSNMVPQNGPMNGGIWRVLEEKVRKWALDRKSIYVFTGPVYADNYPTIGENRVAIPEKLFKVVYDPERKEAISFIIPQ